VIVIEHALDLLAAVDWLVELGPEAGAQGGRMIASGPTADVLRGPTATGRAYRQRLGL
jgi:excinuclease ABC subunit A